MADAGLDFALAIWILNPTGHGDRAVVREHVAIQRIQRGIVDIGNKHAFAQIVENDDTGGAAQPAKGALMQFGPDASAGAEGQQTTDLRLQPSVITNSRVRRYLWVSGSRTIGLLLPIGK
jgi:hypothetical protein